jgi:hypothetical protein
MIENLYHPEAIKARRNKRPIRYGPLGFSNCPLIE